MNIIIPTSADGDVLAATYGTIETLDWLPEIHPAAFCIESTEPSGGYPMMETGRWLTLLDDL